MAKVKNKNWNPIRVPLYPWVPTMEKIISAHELPILSGPVITITSDYSGSHKSSNYQIISVLYVDLEFSQGWEFQRRKIREQYLRDGRRLSFKALNDRQRQKALIPFLKSTELIHGLSVTLVINKSIRKLYVSKADIVSACQSFGLQCNWKPQALENAMQVAHLMSILIAGLSHPKQNIYWISDEDELFANLQRIQDLQRIIGKYSGHYVKHELGELGMGTTSLDEGDRFEEDLNAIPDLIAGTVAEVSTRLSKSIGGRIPTSIAVPYYGDLSTKSDILSSWIWDKSSRLKKIVIIFEDHGQGRFSVANLSMDDE